MRTGIDYTRETEKLMGLRMKQDKNNLGQELQWRHDHCACVSE